MQICGFQAWKLLEIAYYGKKFTAQEFVSWSKLLVYLRCWPAYEESREEKSIFGWLLPDWSSAELLEFVVLLQWPLFLQCCAMHMSVRPSVRPFIRLIVHLPCWWTVQKWWQIILFLHSRSFSHFTGRPHDNETNVALCFPEILLPSLLVPVMNNILFG